MIFYSESPVTVSDASLLESSQNAMEKNEISNIEQAYQISLAPSGESGYTFGQMQWDLAASGSDLAVEEFKKVLDKSGLLDATSINSILETVNKQRGQIYFLAQ